MKENMKYCLQQSVNSKEQGKLFSVRLGERGRHGKIKSNNEEIQGFCEKNGHSVEFLE